MRPSNNFLTYYYHHRIREISVKIQEKRGEHGSLKTSATFPKIRIDTNGHANLFYGRNILPELKGLIDSLSISLDAENAEVYEKICQPSFGKEAYPAVLEFIKEAKKYIPDVEASIVDLPMVDQAACKKIAEKLGVRFRVRSYYEEKYIP